MMCVLWELQRYRIHRMEKLMLQTKQGAPHHAPGATIRRRNSGHASLGTAAADLRLDDDRRLQRRGRPVACRACDSRRCAPQGAPAIAAILKSQGPAARLFIVSP